MSGARATSAAVGHAWRNWGRNQEVRPREVVVPGGTDELVRLVRRAAETGRRVKVVGSGHSFTGVALAPDIQVRLDRLTGIMEADRDTGRVRVWAGTPLHELNEALWLRGLAMPNLGDIDRQTLSGALATGTHGTGGDLPGLTAGVVGLTLVTADGSVVTCSQEYEPDLFHAARLGLGALGIIIAVDLACVPGYRLRAVERPDALMPVLDRIDDMVEANRHVEFYWFPHTDRVQTKVNNMVDEADPGRPLPRWRETLDDHLLANTLFEGINRVLTVAPALTPSVNQLSARALTAREYTDRSYRVFCTRRTVRFVESEYAVPRAALREVLLGLKDWVDRHDVRLPFPVEIRFAAPDDVWLSTGYERANAYVAVHQYHRMDPQPYFDAFEGIVGEHHGRPHWGKLHSLSAADLERLYPRFQDVLAVRDRVDPDRLFGNPYLDRVLGP